MISASAYPAPTDGTYVARNFRFHTGETLPEVRLAYRTIGDPKGEPVLVLHGTGGSSASMLTPGFAGHLFGPGQPLDAERHFIVLPDALGAGRSSKPSDGLGPRFPKLDYDDMVDAQHRLVTEHLGIRRLRLVLGNSMGGMHAWVWATRYPDAMDAVVPMAAQPTAMSGRNWMLRRLLIETVKADPDFRDGNYMTQPRAMALSHVLFTAASNGGELALARQAPTRALADRMVDERIAAANPGDANDFIAMWQASANYDPAPRLDRVAAHLLAIVSADDERNPVATGLLAEAVGKVRNGRLHIIPASPHTMGHGTTGNLAGLWSGELARFLAQVPRGRPAQ